MQESIITIHSSSEKESSAKLKEILIEFVKINYLDKFIDLWKEVSEGAEESKIQMFNTLISQEFNNSLIKYYRSSYH